ncbi:MAG: FAD-dependent oxidoreductase [Candidatus Ancaeobacter aquaticus]|nr:FAD-dependent oxidoreductase [Candidatus Ancaeobacter aquaticus]
MSQLNKVVVIGCSGCGALAARTLKRLNPSLHVTIIREQEEKGLLTRCVIPYICCGNVMVEPSYKDDNIFISQGIQLVDVKAVGINRGEKAVTTADGKDYSYDKLVLAVGAKPVIPPIPGVNLPGVFFLRTSADAVNILHWINSRRVKNLVLIGAGAIGIEIAYLISRHGVNVILVEMFEHVMQNILDADMSEEVETYMREKDIDLQLSQQVKAIEGKSEVEKVLFSSGKEVKAEMVIISAGAKPNSELAEKAGLDMGKLGLRVDNYLQSSDPDIYAGGDLVQYQSHITGKPILGQLRPNAVIAGRIIARNILGYKLKFPPLLNSFTTKFYNKSIAGTGITESESKENGIDIISARQNSISKHSEMIGKKPYVIKLLFNRQTEKIIGGQIVSDSECPVKHIDLIALAIRSGLTALDLMTLRCAGQPELSSNPGIEPLSLAAEKAFETLHNNTEK